MRCFQADLTWTKGIHRVSGTVVGSLFSYLVLLSPRTANNPYVLTALLCAWTALCSLANFTRLRYGAFLALYTGSMLTLVSHDCLPQTFMLPVHNVCGMNFASCLTVQLNIHQAMRWADAKLMLCLLQAQYNGVSTGFSYQYALARTVDVAIASAFVMLVVSVVPWYVAPSIIASD